MIPTATVPQSVRPGPSFCKMVHVLTFKGPAKARNLPDLCLFLHPLAQLFGYLLHPCAVWARRSLAARTPGRLGRLTPKTIQSHEEHKNSKKCLLEPYLLLYLFDVCRRQPLSRISLRRVVVLAGQRVGWAEAPRSMVLPPRSCARFDEYGASRTVGTALSNIQSYLDRADSDVARSAVGQGQRSCIRMIERDDILGRTCL